MSDKSLAQVLELENLRNAHEAASRAASLAGSLAERSPGRTPAAVAEEYVGAYLAARERLSASQATEYAAQIHGYKEQINRNFEAMQAAQIPSIPDGQTILNSAGFGPRTSPPEADAAELHRPKKPTPPGPPAAVNVLRNGYHGTCSASGSVEVKWRGLENGDAFAERAAQLIEFAVLPFASIPNP